MNPKRKIVFVYNPTSGTIRLIPVIPIIERFVNRDLYDFSIVSTQYRGHATELARQYAAQNYDAVIAVGGDGTVNEVGRGLIGTNTALGIIPCGSGNGLARHLGIPMDPFKAVKWLDKSIFSELLVSPKNVSITFDTLSVLFSPACGISFVPFPYTFISR